MTDVISYEDLVFEWETLDNKTLHIYTYKSEDGIMKQHDEFKCGAKVEVISVYEDHPAHVDEDSGKYPEGVDLANLQQLVGTVGVVEDSWYNSGYESHWVVLVRFSDGTEEAFSPGELSLTDKEITTVLPKQAKMVVEYSPLSAEERDCAVGLINNLFTSLKSVSEIDQVLQHKEYYIKQCILTSIHMNEALSQNWYRGD